MFSVAWLSIVDLVDAVGEVIDALTGPDDKFEQAYGFKKPGKEEKNIVFYCQAGRRSSIATTAARDLGWKHARNYEGSWSEWSQQQGK